MWTNENRGRYDRSKLRYPSDLTDEEWSIIGPLIPAAKRGGNKLTGGRAGGRQRADVHSQHGLPVGLAAKGLAAAQPGERLLLPVEL
jgi:hypothetical protein